MLAFAAALPHLRPRVERDLRRKGLPRERVLATVVRLLETALIRIGNEEYARAAKQVLDTPLGHPSIQSAEASAVEEHCVVHLS